MKITRNKNESTFQDLKVGDVFLSCDEELCLKISAEKRIIVSGAEEIVNAVSLENNYLQYFGPDDRVIRKEATLTIVD